MNHPNETGDAWNAGAAFVGVYHGIKYYSRDGKILCLFGWRPMEFSSIPVFKRELGKWENKDT